MNKQEVYMLIEQHYIDNFKDIVKRLGGYIGAAHNAEDIVQEAYTRALTYWKSYDSEQDINNWMHIIINNSMKDFFKDEIMQGMVDNPNYMDILPASAFSKLELEELYKIIEQKPENIKKILNLYLVEGYSAKEVEEIVPENSNNIRKIVQRFREEIK